MSSNLKVKVKARVVILSGPSGCGKTTLHKALLDNGLFKGRLVKSISATTRPRRPQEKEGQDYIFLTPKVFEQRIKKGFFLEWQKVFDRYYGTPKKQVLALLKKGIHVLLCIDVQGAKNVIREFPDAVRIFIKTPSLKILQKRLLARASEDHKSLRVRLKRATRELKEARHYDHVVINADFKNALEKLKKIISQELFVPFVPHHRVD